MKIIRKQLTANEMVSSALRINPSTGLVQRTYDGGSTWVDSPTDDPRSNPIYRLPALTTTDAQCEAAQGLADFTKSSMDYEISQLALGAGVVALVNGLVSLIYVAFPEVAWFNLVFDFAGGLLAAGSVALDTAFTPTVYDQLACIFSQHMDSSGQISPTAMTAILTAIDSTFGSTSLVNITMQGWFANLGSVGASNLGVQNAHVGADCSACEWCAGWDFTVSTTLPPGATLGNLNYVSGHGYQVTTLSSPPNHYDGWIHVPIDIAANHVTHAILHAYVVGGAGDGGYILDGAGAPICSTLGSYALTCDCVVTGRSDTALYFYVGTVGGVGSYIQSIILMGTGANPFGENNC